VDRIQTHTKFTVVFLDQKAMEIAAVFIRLAVSIADGNLWTEPYRGGRIVCK
jgi:hypothetical protein